MIATPAFARHARAHPKPASAQQDNSQPSIRDMGDAVPASDASKLPSTEQQYQTLQKQLEANRPAVAAAKVKSAQLASQAKALRTQLIVTAARVQQLESDKITLDARIVSLAAEEQSLSAGFANDRVAVSRLLAILERLQHDMPPIVVLKSDDALGAVHTAMLMGASLPRVYGAAAALARRIDALRDTRKELVERRAESAKNAAQLTVARNQLDQLLATKQAAASEAENQYGNLQNRLDTIAEQASDLQALLARVSELRRTPARQNVVVVAAENGGFEGMLAKGALLRPVAGTFAQGGVEGVGGGEAPGITFLTDSGAHVVTPADGQVLFAGPYHKTGQVLILETAGGYDLVLAGLNRVAVRPGDQLLAGEPLGTMPDTAQPRLYFELRYKGKGASPAPWLAGESRKKS